MQKQTQTDLVPLPLLREKERVTHEPRKTLAQRVVETLPVVCLLRLLAARHRRLDFFEPPTERLTRDAENAALTIFFIQKV